MIPTITRSIGFTFGMIVFATVTRAQYHGGGGGKITDWLKKSLIENKPYDQFVKELINPVKGSDGFIKGISWRGAECIASK